ncbi:MAG: hypothetical protein J6N54_05555 [Bacteroidales bacterium]|nr:hypothetical protein [Bacteroidales bacterium]
MKLRSIILILSTAAMTVLTACHKEKDSSSTVSPYLDGTLKFSMSLFALPGQEFSLTPSGASNPSGEGVGYCWYCSWITERDTVKTPTGVGDGSWSFTAPESTGTYTVHLMAFAPNYSALNTSQSFTVVDPSLNGSLKGAGYQADSVKFIDPRDGATYYLATTGGKVWMQNNLYFTGKGVSYEYSPAMDKIAGRLYNWNEAKEACPEGWHLPSDAEFTAMVGSSVEKGETVVGSAGDLMADVTFNDAKMWTFWPEVKISNKAKFSAAPFGYAVDQDGAQKYYGTNSYAAFWTSDSEGDAGLYRYIYVSKNNIYSAWGDKQSFRASVRCVKD